MLSVVRPRTPHLTGGATVFHVVFPAIALSAYAWWAPGLVDVPRLARLFGMWVVVCVVIFVVSLVVARRGREGRWTVYLLIFGYGASLHQLRFDEIRRVLHQLAADEFAKPIQKRTGNQVPGTPRGGGPRASARELGRGLIRDSL
jgi:hypothetical protein